jgi:hypothetical protein
MNLNLAVIFDGAQFSEAIHKQAHSGPGGADHLRQYLLADLRNPPSAPTVAPNAPTVAPTAPTVAPDATTMTPNGWSP